MAVPNGVSANGLQGGKSQKSCCSTPNPNGLTPRILGACGPPLAGVKQGFRPFESPVRFPWEKGLDS